MKKELLMFAIAALLGCVSVNGHASELCDGIVKGHFDYPAHITARQAKRSMLDCARRYREAHAALLNTHQLVQFIHAKDPSNLPLLEALSVIDAKARKYRADFVQLEKRADEMQIAVPVNTRRKIPM